MNGCKRLNHNDEYEIIRNIKFKIFVFKNLKFLSRNQRTNNKINQTLNIPR